MTQQEIEREVANFKRRNYLHFDDNELDLPIYRIFPFESLLEMLNTNNLTLVKTRMWEDPYENFLLKCNASMLNGTPVNLKDLQEQIFGQCWTLYPETDAFWRIYSYSKNGVRIKTTVRKLFDVIFDNSSYSTLTTSFIGKVQYDTVQNIGSLFSDPNYIGSIVQDTTGQGLVEAQLIKRIEFEHEKEIRLLYSVDSSSPDIQNDIKHFSINPNNLIDDIMFDPRISSRYENIYRQTILSLGFRNPILKSQLYNFTPVNIRLPF
ncbi:MAG: hypothetical protein C0594_05995 [Marinilabiliales bacterium]|nr:MAG: hypothetical protein C0594_05995 [Marinilabiliales bacterium]